MGMLSAQKKNADFVYHIHRASGPVIIDGRADEAAWAEAELAADFFMVLPMDTSKAQVHTEVRMLYDDTHFYLVAINYEKLPGPYYVESLRRDFSFGKNDNFLLFIDPFDDQINGFTFGANAMGAQWDGLLYNGGSADLSWDNKWRSEVTTMEDKWVFEMAVPFKTIRYKPGITRWGVNFSRLDLKAAEKSAWAPVPRQFPTASLAYTGVLAWDEPPPPAGANVSLIPYTLGGTSKDFENDKETGYRFEAGGDVKVGITSSLNLDLTVNPDFSQVEVDVQQTNLDRFELFFPERRQFFIENADLFANFGLDRIRPFFSRRIGLNAPIWAGARLSGKLNKNWRIGVLNMQTGKSDTGTPAQNFGVVALQRQLFARSNLSAIFINQETFDYGQEEERNGISRYNRNFGLEYNLASSNNIWTGKLLYLKSFTPGINGDDQVFAGRLAYDARRWNIELEHQYVGENYRAKVGFVPRVGFHRSKLEVGRLFFPESGPVLSHGPAVDLTYFFDDKFKETDDELVFIYRVNFQDRSDFHAWAAHNFVQLLDPFDPTNYAGDSLDANTKHRWNSWGLEYTSKPQSRFTYSFSTRYGGYFADGRRLRLGGEIGYRFQPYVAITMNADYNRIRFFDDERLPALFIDQNYDFWLVGPRIDVTLTNKLFLTNFLQYNNQTKNVNLNVRLQWRYSPASDLFIVYTDNYYSDIFQVRNRALVFKMTYWWNL
jgi:hypothetical protein